MTVKSRNTPVPNLVRVKRALLSVADKTGLVIFAKKLAELDIELVSTGGTSNTLKDAGLKVRDISELTDFPEIMDGRVKTLHPKVHGGILAIRDEDEHQQAMSEHDIQPIDMVISNLYPFESTVASGADYANCVENIDIGGPTLIRASAKNHAYVAVVTNPSDYNSIALALAENDGSLPYSMRQSLAQTAFAKTASYDAAISNWFAQSLGIDAPQYRTISGTLSEVMRYGENPHQSAAFYTSGLI